MVIVLKSVAALYSQLQRGGGNLSQKSQLVGYGWWFSLSEIVIWKYSKSATFTDEKLALVVSSGNFQSGGVNES